MLLVPFAVEASPVSGRNSLFGDTIIQGGQENLFVIVTTGLDY